jgi:Helix-turn-helix domain
MAKTTRRQTTRLAYSIERLAKESDISRSMIYEEITAGRLIARKVGRRTIVRRSDALRWLRSLPQLSPADHDLTQPGSILIEKTRIIAPREP